jgi:hypothetical protein
MGNLLGKTDSPACRPNSAARLMTCCTAFPMKWKSSSNAKASTATTAKAGCCTAPPATRNRKPACAVPGLAIRQGLTENDYRWLSPSSWRSKSASPPYGGIYAPHVATIHPAKLVRGLARTVERMGVDLRKQPGHPLAVR